MNKQEKFDALRLVYATKPCTFARDVLKITPDIQQYGLIEAGCGYETREAVKSATGTGKTCALAVIILHQLFIYSDIKIIATSPSAGQLDRGLIAEVAKLINNIEDEEIRDMFVLMSDNVHIKGARKLQFCSFVTASAENKENLAGVHAEDKVIVIIDEASAISQDIYDTLVGNLTTKGCSMIQTSNPVRSSGPFKNLWDLPPEECIWNLHTFTAANSAHVSPRWVDMIRTEYGEDSDFYRMRVMGEFPRASSSTFIGNDIILAAMENLVPPSVYRNYPILVGADIARFGDDLTVFVVRQGPKILDIRTYSKLDTMQIASELLLYAREMRADKVFVDGIGVGAGVVDRCRQLGLNVVDVVVAARPSNPKEYSNLRSECWGNMRDWLRNGADIPKDNRKLRRQLESMQYSYNNKMQIQLMTKKDIKSKLGLESTDIPDAISLTFAEEVYKTNNIGFQVRQIDQADVLWA